MRRTTAARTKTRRIRRTTAVGLGVVTAAVIGTLAFQSGSASAPLVSEVQRVDHGGTTTQTDGVVTEDDGTLPDGVTVFDDRYPGVANLDPDLLQALREAATDAADDGVQFYVNSGWRSPDYQDRLFREAVSEYGSEEDAARWVATVDTSAHVSGDAVDIGSFDATAWLSEHGAGYGLCQIYGNESWHYELRPKAIDRGCPPMYADSTHDRRMSSAGASADPSPASVTSSRPPSRPAPRPEGLPSIERVKSRVPIRSFLACCAANRVDSRGSRVRVGSSPAPFASPLIPGKSSVTPVTALSPVRSASSLAAAAPTSCSR
jgi:zinc D-Ala-D-Ala carboxypeptidase